VRLLVVEEEGGLEPVRVREVDVAVRVERAPHLPHAVDVRVVRVQDRVTPRRVVHAHVLEVVLAQVAAPVVHVVVRVDLQRPGARVGPVARAVWLPVEQRRQRRVGDELPVHGAEVELRLLLRGAVELLHAVEVHVQEPRRGVRRVAQRVVQHGPRAVERGRHRHALRRVPVPERQREGRVADQLAQDALVVVEVRAVQRLEEPRVVHLDVELRAARLPVSPRAVGAVDVGVLVEAAPVGPGQRLHQLHGTGEVGQELGAHLVHPPAHAQPL
jgi:hypothetical protein